ncbi:MAG: tetratricopeptide repeat protein, partial [Flavobacteriaceae bacterium]
MRYVLLIISFIFSILTFGQNTTLADAYFNDGEYNKAITEYSKIIDKQPYRTDIFIKKIKCYQELEQFNLAEKDLLKKINTKNSPPELYVELGYNYSFKKDLANSASCYNKALTIIESNPIHARAIGRAFEKYNLLDEAEKAYTTA